MDEEEIDIFIKRLAKVLEKAKSEDIEGTNGKSTLLFSYKRQLIWHNSLILHYKKLNIYVYIL